MKKIRWRALDTEVIVVAKEGHVGDWAAYIGAVRGRSHDLEWKSVAEHGSKLHESVARILFPSFDDLSYCP